MAGTTEEALYFLGEHEIPSLSLNLDQMGKVSHCQHKLADCVWLYEPLFWLLSREVWDSATDHTASMGATTNAENLLCWKITLSFHSRIKRKTHTWCACAMSSPRIAQANVLKPDFFWLLQKRQAGRYFSLQMCQYGTDDNRPRRSGAPFVRLIAFWVFYAKLWKEPPIIYGNEAWFCLLLRKSHVA